MLDIDHFKQVNDIHGHAKGDEVIVRLAEILRQASRGEDVIARFGGEEFVVFLPGANLSEARQCAERIRTTCEKLEFRATGDEVLHVTLSAGVAEIGIPNESLESALARADRALYEAKNAGRNRVCVCAQDEIRVGRGKAADQQPITRIT